jgi:copper chaperone CopZ
MMEFKVPNLATAKCASTVMGAVKGVDGAAHCEVDLEGKRVLVDSLMPPTDFVEAMEEVGYLATLGIPTVK